MRTARGFTLIELMIVVVVVAILAAIAYPSYLDYIRKSKRADAHTALLRVQLEQEKFRVSNPAYAANMDALDALAGWKSGDVFLSPDEHYEVDIVDGSASATAFTVRATGLGTQVQDTGCTEIRLVVAAGEEDREPANCW
ncbi:pilus assembly protein [Thioalkalivibrio paradoxus ARh 1]|uniref:Pilus assembly protein n=2 Tax=Thioalkalivibrio paradoxus TaxID=108010 RepID=W0DJX4_9GAMM|nr:pilus assembly protein [Thioalkalivibrio paradoxus ARh 1]